jgi:hypothetical protein
MLRRNLAALGFVLMTVTVSAQIPEAPGGSAVAPRDEAPGGAHPMLPPGAAGILVHAEGGKAGRADGSRDRHDHGEGKVQRHVGGERSRLREAQSQGEATRESASLADAARERVAREGRTSPSARSRCGTNMDAFGHLSKGAVR